MKSSSPQSEPVQPGRHTQLAAEQTPLKLQCKSVVQPFHAPRRRRAGKADTSARARTRNDARSITKARMTVTEFRNSVFAKSNN